ncbi:MAG: 3-phosphoshikimate 1-carboxyvinyltransferase [candidate division Zixibacteria bacterium]|nr:3-phosphoshikimate 1-carboxyvinyltransferase [candidate division Zixibacteria bacterium]MBU1470255.1 3-phosphoshikimate 1-carboxyvinyltransferase [candidate division Zixibacteria bacterium]MBU2626427.1 3-phosphoshikimate 1-carboxyvinyltransferase [candidate division Zixibacteria bacterium]
MAQLLRGRVNLPGDKSISHRAVLLSSISEGNCTIRNLATGKDLGSTVDAVRQLGVEISESEPSVLQISGVGMNNFVKPEGKLNCGNAGTSLRLLLGLLAGSNISAKLDGDSSLRKRPVNRVAIPLRHMGADIETTDRGTCPVTVIGKRLSGIGYALPVASAQVKSAILLAALSASGETEIVEPTPTRDHTERMLISLGVPLTTSDCTVSTGPASRIPAFDIDIPGDISSAAFVVLPALLLPNSEIVLENVCLNPTRCGYLQILRRMGADIATDEIAIKRGEPVGKLFVRASRMHSSRCDDIPVATFIDEVPILALAATQADGVTRISRLGELRVKESDRLSGIVTVLGSAGAKIQVEEDDLVICGPTKLFPPDVGPQHDHRMAMLVETINLISEGQLTDSYADAISISFPEYYEVMKSLLD